MVRSGLKESVKQARNAATLATCSHAWPCPNLACAMSDTLRVIPLHRERDTGFRPLFITRNRTLACRHGILLLRVRGYQLGR